MPKFIIYNQSSYFYHICDDVYNIFKPHFNESEIEVINCVEKSIDMNDEINLYLTFIPFSRLNIIQTPKKYIVYNFEQFTTDKNWSEDYINFLKKAVYVIDYSLINITKFAEYNINAFFLPYQPSGIYKHPELLITKKDIDVLFIGNLNNKRKKWIKELIDDNINLKVVTNLFYEKSIEYFAKSKIILNVHYYNNESTLEVTRIIPALENNCIVVSEISHDPYYNTIYEDTIKITTSENLKNDVKNILNNYEKYVMNCISNFKLSQQNNTIDINSLIRFIKNILINEK
jgi:hypothetical protein